MNRLTRVVAGALVGAACGLIVFFGTRRLIGSERHDGGADQQESPRRRPDAQRALSQGRPVAPMECVGGSHELAAEQEAWAGQWNDFVATWGVPSTPPEQWDPVAEAAEISRRIAQLVGVGLFDVDCAFHPCVALVVSRVEPDLAHVRTVLQPGANGLHAAEFWEDDRTLTVSTAVFGSPTTPEEKRWMARLENRIRERNMHEITALLREAEIEAR
jgi:hypothetical protein